MNKFVASALAGIALAGAAGPVLAQAITPVAVTVTNSQGLALRAFRFVPPATAGTGPFPAVVMMHGCAGVYSFSQPNAGFNNIQLLFRDWGTRLARAGYVALLVDSFTGRRDANGVQVPQNQCGNGSAGVSEVNDRPLDALAGFDHLVGTAALNVDRNRVGALGWSHGGSSVMATLSDTQAVQPFRAAVSMYPGCGMFNAFGGITNSTYTPYAPFQILHAGDDPLFTSRACQTRQDRAWQRGDANFQAIVSYAGAAHSFDACTATSGSCSAADVQARSQADAATLNFFSAQMPVTPAGERRNGLRR